MKISTWISLAGVLISAIALIISLIGVFRVLDKIEIRWHDSVIKANPGDIIGSEYSELPLPILVSMSMRAKGKKDSTEAQASLTFPSAYIMQLTIINYGSNEMGYFGLQVKDDNGKSFPIITTRSLNEAGAKYLLERVEKSRWLNSDIPNDISGIIPAHSFIKRNVVIDADLKSSNNLLAQIAITKKRWYKPWSKSYLVSAIKYDLNSTDLKKYWLSPMPISSPTLHKKPDGSEKSDNGNNQGDNS